MAASLTTLATFDANDGAGPYGRLITDADGDLFGTTRAGGPGYGTVFEITKTSAGYSSTPITIANFTGLDGANPFGGLITDAAGDLFGTTQEGGLGGGVDSVGVGTVFEIPKTANSYSSTPITIASFNITNGETPEGSLITDAAGDLFGTTQNGGPGNWGTVFEIPKTANGYSSTPITVATFNTYGANPNASLITDAEGDLLGTTAAGGSGDEGTVFEIAKTADGYSGTPITIASFNGTNGAYPAGSLITDAAGDLFGTTYEGGSFIDGIVSTGYGTVFEIAKTASGYSAPITLVAFHGTDGANPLGSLILDAAGDIFGTTEDTAFEITKTGNSYSSTPTTLVFFGLPDAANAVGGLGTDTAGNLFGTEFEGGYENDFGSVFEITNSGFVVSAPSETQTVTVTGTAGAAGAAGQLVTATATTAGDTANTASAQGGAGGAGGKGGNATATAASSDTGTSTGTATATAIGGAGGASSGSAAAPFGGTATAAASSVATGAAIATATATGGANTGTEAGATATATGQTATATAIGTGGKGADRSGAGVTAGAGGAVNGKIATATNATATGITAATASATQTGGAGGAGSNGANGGSGAASTLINAVAGSTNGGTLTLTQTANGGNGGASGNATGGNGGSAWSYLTLDDTKSTTHSAAILATLSATGGSGGNGATGGNGSFGSAGLTLTSTGSITAQVTGTGGAGTKAGTGTATSVLSGTQINATTTATSGLGTTTAATGYASAQATGTSGSTTATANTGLTSSNFIIGESATATTTVSGTSNAITEVLMGTSLPWWATGSEAALDALPTAAAVSSALTNTPNTSAVFAGNATVLALGELGAAHSGSVKIAQTNYASTDITLNLLQLASKPDLFLSFYKAVGSAYAISDVGLTVSANGTTLLAESFASGSAAAASLNDHPLDLGSLATGTLAQSLNLDLHIGLSVTTTAPGGVFTAGLVIGEAPASPHWAVT